MYNRKTTRKYKGKAYINYLLLELLYTPQGPRQTVICSLGDLKPRPKEEWLELAERMRPRGTRCRAFGPQVTAREPGFGATGPQDQPTNCAPGRFTTPPILSRSHSTPCALILITMLQRSSQQAKPAYHIRGGPPSH